MQRVIFLVDMNAFFISCEMTRNQDLVGRPAAVAGDPKKRTGIILAANYEAREYGVKTAMVLHEAKKLCPDMVLVPPDHGFYESMSKRVMTILNRYTPIIEQNSIDEAWLDMTGCESLFGKPSKAAQGIMDSIRGELGLWCSIGISENRFLAKMASEMKKPLGITELWREEIQYKLWPLPVSSMYGIGRQTAVKLKGLGIETIGDLAVFNRQTLEEKLGKYGVQLSNLANGLDDSQVIPHNRGEMKSIGRSTTLPEDITDIEQAKRVLMLLCEEIGAEARKYGKKGRTVQLTIKYGNFQSITRQTTFKPTYLTREIYGAGLKLLEKNWDANKPVRLLGVSLSGFFSDCEMDQISLFNCGGGERGSEKEERLERAMDAIRRKHGYRTVGRAALMSYKRER
ncbi:MAG: DNA polymerase IV [Clostridiales bacterium]|jgi:DNA polymerase-4|nr:DNA polymerase IV [Eubacteriales bacterium]MDH7565627.1 DNA polymerase IV [Clostridiales bacterium]